MLWIIFWGKGCTACIWTCCVSVGEWLSWRYQAQKGTKEQVKIPNTATLLLIWSAEHHQKTTALMQNTACRYLYCIWYLYFLLFISSWGIGCCNDTYVQTIFLEGHGEKRYPNDTPKRNLRALGRRPPAHPPTWTKHWHTKSWCNVFPFHISWVEAMAWKKEKKNQTLLSKATSKGFDHYPNIAWPKNPTLTLGSSI